MNAPSHTTPRIVIVGGGFGGLETVLYLRHRLGDRVALTLVSDRPTFMFKPYLAYLPFGLVPERFEIDLEAFAEAHNTEFVCGHVQADEPHRKAVTVDGRDLHYDRLIAATGASCVPSPVPGLQDYALTTWREADLLVLRGALHTIVHDVGHGRRWRLLFLVPPGSQWAGPLYEMAFMIETWLRWRRARPSVELTFVTTEPSFMHAIGRPAHDALERAFGQRGIAAHTGHTVERVEAGQVTTDDGAQLPFDLLLSAPLYRGGSLWHLWPTDGHGFLRVHPETRQVLGQPDVYAVGDIANFPIKQAIHALLQADAAAEHIAATLLHEEPAFGYQPSTLWVMEQLDQALLMEGRTQRADATPVVETVSVGQLRRMDVNAALNRRYDTRNPLYAGLLWKGAKTGLESLPFLLRPGVF